MSNEAIIAIAAAVTGVFGGVFALIARAVLLRMQAQMRDASIELKAHLEDRKELARRYDVILRRLGTAEKKLDDSNTRINTIWQENMSLQKRLGTAEMALERANLKIETLTRDMADYQAWAAALVNQVRGLHGEPISLEQVKKKRSHLDSGSLDDADFKVA